MTRKLTGLAICCVAALSTITPAQSGTYGAAEIAGVEIGNEYWGSGEMTSVEYGRLAAEMSRIVDDELRLVAEHFGVETNSVGVLVQMGHNYGSSRLSDAYDGWEKQAILDDLAATNGPRTPKTTTLRKNPKTMRSMARGAVSVWPSRFFPSWRFSV